LKQKIRKRASGFNNQGELHWFLYSGERSACQLDTGVCGIETEENKMRQINNSTIKIHRRALSGLLVAGLLVVGSTPISSRDKYETIEATAMGTGTQLGQNIGVTLNIYEFSTPADRQILVEAYEKGQNQGLVNALQRMKAVGHVELTGTLGNDCAFIRMIPTATGRKIVFVTNRQIRFGEAWADSQSMSFNLTAGIIEINDQDKSKSTGVVYPAAQLAMDKQGQLQWELNQNAWKLVDIIDWKGTPGVN
jgi:hypothetical protein